MYMRDYYKMCFIKQTMYPVLVSNALGEARAEFCTVKTCTRNKSKNILDNEITEVDNKENVSVNMEPENNTDEKNKKELLNDERNDAQSTNKSQLDLILSATINEGEIIRIRSKNLINTLELKNNNSDRESAETFMSHTFIKNLGNQQLDLSKTTNPRNHTFSEKEEAKIPVDVKNDLIKLLDEIDTSFKIKNSRSGQIVDNLEKEQHINLEKKKENIRLFEQNSDQIKKQIEDKMLLNLIEEIETKIKKNYSSENRESDEWKSYEDSKENINKQNSTLRLVEFQMKKLNGPRSSTSILPNKKLNKRICEKALMEKIQQCVFHKTSVSKPIDSSNKISQTKDKTSTKCYCSESFNTMKKEDVLKLIEEYKIHCCGKRRFSSITENEEMMINKKKERERRIDQLVNEIKIMSKDRGRRFSENQDIKSTSSTAFDGDEGTFLKPASQQKFSKRVSFIDEIFQTEDGDLIEESEEEYFDTSEYQSEADNGVLIENMISGHSVEILDEKAQDEEISQSEEKTAETLQEGTTLSNIQESKHNLDDKIQNKKQLKRVEKATETSDEDTRLRNIISGKSNQDLNENIQNKEESQHEKKATKISEKDTTLSDEIIEEAQQNLNDNIQNKGKSQHEEKAAKISEEGTTSRDITVEESGQDLNDKMQNKEKSGYKEKSTQTTEEDTTLKDIIIEKSEQNLNDKIQSREKSQHEKKATKIFEEDTTSRDITSEESQQKLNDKIQNVGKSQHEEKATIISEKDTTTKDITVEESRQNLNDKMQNKQESRYKEKDILISKEDTILQDSTFEESEQKLIEKNQIKKKSHEKKATKISEEDTTSRDIISDESQPKLNDKIQDVEKPQHEKKATIKSEEDTTTRDITVGESRQNLNDKMQNKKESRYKEKDILISKEDTILQDSTLKESEQKFIDKIQIKGKSQHEKNATKISEEDTTSRDIISEESQPKLNDKIQNVEKSQHEKKATIISEKDTTTRDITFGESRQNLNDKMQNQKESHYKGKDILISKEDTILQDSTLEESEQKFIDKIQIKGKSQHEKKATKISEEDTTPRDITVWESGQNKNHKMQNKKASSYKEKATEISEEDTTLSNIIFEKSKQKLNDKIQNEGKSQHEKKAPRISEEGTTIRDTTTEESEQNLNGNIQNREKLEPENKAKRISEAGTTLRDKITEESEQKLNDKIKNEEKSQHEKKTTRKSEEKITLSDMIVEKSEPKLNDKIQNEDKSQHEKKALRISEEGTTLRDIITVESEQNLNGNIQNKEKSQSENKAKRISEDNSILRDIIAVESEQNLEKDSIEIIKFKIITIDISNQKEGSTDNILSEETQTDILNKGEIIQEDKDKHENSTDVQKEDITKEAEIQVEIIGGLPTSEKNVTDDAEIMPMPERRKLSSEEGDRKNRKRKSKTDKKPRKISKQITRDRDRKSSGESSKRYSETIKGKEEKRKSSELKRTARKREKSVISKEISVNINEEKTRKSMETITEEVLRRDVETTIKSKEKIKISQKVMTEEESMYDKQIQTAQPIRHEICYHTEEEKTTNKKRKLSENQYPWTRKTMISLEELKQKSYTEFTSNGLPQVLKINETDMNEIESQYSSCESLDSIFALEHLKVDKTECSYEKLFLSKHKMLKTKSEQISSEENEEIQPIKPKSDYFEKTNGLEEKIFAIEGGKEDSCRTKNEETQYTRKRIDRNIKDLDDHKKSWNDEQKIAEQIFPTPKSSVHENDREKESVTVKDQGEDAEKVSELIALRTKRKREKLKLQRNGIKKLKKLDVSKDELLSESPVDTLQKSQFTSARSSVAINQARLEEKKVKSKENCIIEKETDKLSMEIPDSDDGDVKPEQNKLKLKKLTREAQETYKNIFVNKNRKIKRKIEEENKHVENQENGKTVDKYIKSNYVDILEDVELDKALEMQELLKTSMVLKKKPKQISEKTRDKIKQPQKGKEIQKASDEEWSASSITVMKDSMVEMKKNICLCPNQFPGPLVKQRIEKDSLRRSQINGFKYVPSTTTRQSRTEHIVIRCAKGINNIAEQQQSRSYIPCCLEKSSVEDNCECQNATKSKECGALRYLRSHQTLGGFLPTSSRNFRPENNKYQTLSNVYAPKSGMIGSKIKGLFFSACGNENNGAYTESTESCWKRNIEQNRSFANNEVIVKKMKNCEKCCSCKNVLDKDNSCSILKKNISDTTFEKIKDVHVPRDRRFFSEKCLSLRQKNLSTSSNIRTTSLDLHKLKLLQMEKVRSGSSCMRENFSQMKKDFLNSSSNEIKCFPRNQERYQRDSQVSNGNYVEEYDENFDEEKLPRKFGVQDLTRCSCSASSQHDKLSDCHELRKECIHLALQFDEKVTSSSNEELLKRNENHEQHIPMNQVKNDGSDKISSNISNMTEYDENLRKILNTMTSSEQGFLVDKTVNPLKQNESDFRLISNFEKEKNINNIIDSSQKEIQLVSFGENILNDENMQKKSTALVTSQLRDKIKRKKHFLDKYEKERSIRLRKYKLRHHNTFIDHAEDNRDQKYCSKCLLRYKSESQDSPSLNISNSKLSESNHEINSIESKRSITNTNDANPYRVEPFLYHVAVESNQTKEKIVEKKKKLEFFSKDSTKKFINWFKSIGTKVKKEETKMNLKEKNIYSPLKADINFIKQKKFIKSKLRHSKLKTSKLYLHKEQYETMDEFSEVSSYKEGRPEPVLLRIGSSEIVVPDYESDSEGETSEEDDEEKEGKPLVLSEDTFILFARKKIYDRLQKYGKLFYTIYMDEEDNFDHISIRSAESVEHRIECKDKPFFATYDLGGNDIRVHVTKDTFDNQKRDGIFKDENYVECQNSKIKLSLMRGKRYLHDLDPTKAKIIEIDCTNQFSEIKICYDNTVPSVPCLCEYPQVCKNIQLESSELSSINIEKEDEYLDTQGLCQVCHECLDKPETCEDYEKCIEKEICRKKTKGISDINNLENNSKSAGTNNSQSSSNSKKDDTNETDAIQSNNSNSANTNNIENAETNNLKNRENADSSSEETDKIQTVQFVQVSPERVHVMKDTKRRYLDKILEKCVYLNHPSRDQIQEYLERTRRKSRKKRSKRLCFSNRPTLELTLTRFETILEIQDGKLIS
ncbi:hypothetical protein HHI36_014061 [Cryptolaemus montrouzieri]|uniref:Uncharacterized protein n=1 Tax=Cryptolaemus montrouzieri TaxID=559131 RepID=A0ABD2N2L2_9CUCU